MTRTTLAAVATDILQMELREFETPPPQPDAGLLKIEAAGICGADWIAYQKSRVPRIMGHENVGTVTELGSIAARQWGLKEGDRVVLEEYLPCGHCAFCRSPDFRLCRETETRGAERTVLRYGTSPLEMAPSLWGGYSQYMYLHSRTVFHRVRSDVPAHLLAMSIPMSNGIQWAQFDGGLRMGQSVLIEGPGQQGLAAVLAARRLGAGLIIVSGLSQDAARLEVAKKYGAHATIDVEKQDLLDEVNRLTGGRGVDLVLDLAGGPNTLVDALRAVTKAGTVVFAAGHNIANFPAQEMTAKRVTLRAARGHTFQAVETAIEMISSGEADLSLMATHRFSLKDADLAVRSIGGKGLPGAVHVSIIPEAA